MWLFGYGSLIWRPGFEHVRSEPARVHGWLRRFYQGSPDHRGTPGSPGRVLTLVEQAGAVCEGRAFLLPEAGRDGVLAALDHREQGGYRRHPLVIELGQGEEVAGFTYLAASDNPHYLGPASADEIAAHVACSVGPSGPNRDYVLELDRALRRRGIEDPHVSEVARHLERLV